MRQAPSSFAPRFSSSNRLPRSRARAFGDDHRVWLGNALQAGCEVRRLADDAALLRFTRADQVADHDQPSGYANASLQ